MGINGNTFTAMNRNPQIVRQAVPLQPELIILSLGTNDSYGRNFDEAAVGAQVEKLIGLLKKYFPLCPLLLTTPMECWSRVRVKGRYVRKPNPNAERVRDQIVQAAGRHGRSGGGAVAAIQNAADVLRTDFALRCIDDRSGHGAHHIVEKSVCAHAQEDQLSPALHVKIIHRADRGLHVRSDGADGSEIMRS